MEYLPTYPVSHSSSQTKLKDRTATIPRTIIVYLTRKPDMTPAAFKHHYETVHIPLLQGLAASSWPLTHTRHYVERKSVNGTTDEPNNQHAASVLAGAQEEFGYDVMAVLVWEDAGVFQKFYECLAEEGNCRRIKEDEMVFLHPDHGTMTATVIDEVNVTARKV